MKTRIASARMAALAATLLLTGTAALAGGPNSVPGERLDSGLGELPPYAQWVDPTGKVPMGPLDEQVRSGVTELSRVDWTASAAGAWAVATMRYGNLQAMVRSGKTELARAEWTSELSRTRVAAEARSNPDAELAQMSRYGITEFVRADADVRVAGAVPHGAR